MASCCTITTATTAASSASPPSTSRAMEESASLKLIRTYDYNRPLFMNSLKSQNLFVPSNLNHQESHPFSWTITTTTSSKTSPRDHQDEDNEKHYDTQVVSSSIASASLSRKVAGDVAVGVASTFCVAPFLTIVDKAIVQRAAGTHTLMTSGFETISTILRNPIQYVKSPIFLYMWAVYAATYSTANSLKTFMEHETTTVRSQTSKNQDTKTNSAGAPSAAMVTFLGTSIVNSGGSLLKDRAYAQMFSGGGATKNATKVFPKISYGLWMTRDFLVIGSGFVLPDIVSKKLHERNQGSMDLATCKKLSQVTLPIVTQFIAGPLQLLGLDFYNRPLTGLSTRAAFMERSQFLLQGYSSVVTARIARIIPGYSIGGVLNTHLRDTYRTFVQDTQELHQPLYNTLHHRRATTMVAH